MAIPSSPTSPQTTLTALLLHKLTHQHKWTQLTPHPPSHPPLDKTKITSDSRLPVISGMPPTRLYIHPDEQTKFLSQISKLKAELDGLGLAGETGDDSEGAVQQRQAINDKIAALQAEYDRPRRLYVAGIFQQSAKGITLGMIADVFNQIAECERKDEEDVSTSKGDTESNGDTKSNVKETHFSTPVARDDGPNTRRFMMGIVDTDSSIAFYFVHDGVVKPRQN